MTIDIISDADDLRVGTEIVLVTTTTPWTFQIAQAGNVAASTRVTLKSLYQCHKLYWLNTTNQLRWPFIWKMITDEIGIIRNGWEPLNDATRKRILGGWKEVNTVNYVDTDAKQEWCALFAGYPDGVLDTEQCYIEQVAGTPVNLTYLGAAAEPVKIFGDSTHGNVNYLSSDIKLRVRTPQRKPSVSNVFTAYNTSVLRGQLYRLTLVTSVDSNASVADIGIDANSDGTADVAPYNGMHLTGYAVAQSKAMSGGSYPFSYIITANAARLQRVHEFMAWEQRKDSDIDEGAGTLNGKCSATATEYIDKFYTRQIATGKGVYVDGMDPVDLSSGGFTDDNGVVRYFDYVAVATALPSAYAQADASAVYAVYAEDEWGTNAATPLLDASGDPMTGDVDGRASIPLTWDWSGNGNQRAVIVITGNTTCQWEIGVFEFIQSTAVTVQIAAAEEIIL